MTERTDWTGALCAQTDPELFFPKVGVVPATAKRLCARCPLRQKCLEAALADPKLEGVWGGTTDQERTRMRVEAAKRAA